MINSFEEFEKQYLADDNDKCKYDFIDSLTEEEIEALQKEVANWTEKEMSEGLRVLSDYYALKVPVDFLKQLCVEDLDLAFEIYSEGISDTCQRTILVNRVLRHIGVGSWPTYGETAGTDVFEKFTDKLKEQAVKHNITILS